LLILITPHVIRSRDEALSVTEQFKRSIGGLERILRAREPAWGVPPDERQPEGLDSR
jgi:hypothetical protein